MYQKPLYRKLSSNMKYSCRDSMAYGEFVDEGCRQIALADLALMMNRTARAPLEGVD